jgi:uracil-DNA glycosylase
LARQVVAHRDVGRFAKLYTLLWRLQTTPGLLENPADADVVAVNGLAKSVGRDCHKMKAFVRFREVPGLNHRKAFTAWFEPDHYIVELTAPFFARRFADMDWQISTPHGIAVFINGALSCLPPDGQRHATADITEDLWRTYYANIFNPARLKVKAMESEMPRKYWKNLPEAALIPELIAGAAQRAQRMRDQMPGEAPSDLAKRKAPAVAHPVFADAALTSLETIAEATRHCTRCPLHCHATQAVPGEGNAQASLMFVGEQPGDQEDIAGRPFVGPAGQIFDEAVAAAGLSRADLYVTNAVKHFKFSTRGKRRIHERPNRSEIQHCRWWLDKELQIVKPQVVIAMGATALFALTGESSDIKAKRGMPLKTSSGVALLATYHPSAILRHPTESARIRRDFFSDVAMAARI